MSEHLIMHLKANPCAFSLSAIGEEGNFDWRALRDFIENSTEAKNTMNEHGDSENTTYWHTWDDELIEWSKKHPDTIFVLNIEEPTRGFYVNTYFRNGQLRADRGRIVYPPAPEWAAAYDK